MSFLSLDNFDSELPNIIFGRIKPKDENFAQLKSTSNTTTEILNEISSILNVGEFLNGFSAFLSMRLNI